MLKATFLRQGIAPPLGVALLALAVCLPVAAQQLYADGPVRESRERVLP